MVTLIRHLSDRIALSLIGTVAMLFTESANRRWLQLLFRRLVTHQFFSGIQIRNEIDKSERVAGIFRLNASINSE